MIEYMEIGEAMKKYAYKIPMPERYDGRRKLMTRDIENMRRDREEGMTYRELGEKYNVTSVTACYHCNKDYNKYTRELRIVYSLSHRDKERTLASVKRTYSKKIALHEEGLI